MENNNGRTAQSRAAAAAPAIEPSLGCELRRLRPQPSTRRQQQQQQQQQQSCGRRPVERAVRGRRRHGAGRARAAAAARPPPAAWPHDRARAALRRGGGGSRRRAGRPRGHAASRQIITASPTWLRCCGRIRLTALCAAAGPQRRPRGDLAAAAPRRPGRAAMLRATPNPQPATRPGDDRRNDFTSCSEVLRPAGPSEAGPRPAMGGPPLGSLREAQGVTQAAVCEVVQNPGR
eukprot:scaffold3581_cov58-Phaeocystis_antarctica.AAC.2